MDTDINKPCTTNIKIKFVHKNVSGNDGIFLGASNYSTVHSVINLCDRRITLLSDTDISFGLFNLF
jgi:hypothetical protein